MIRRTVACLALLLLAQPLAAQRNELTFELSVLHGAVGYAHRVAPRALLGLEAGFGFPQLDRTLDPGAETADFQEYLHLAGFARFQPSAAVDIDAGLRASVADLWDCTASDCWPALFAGAYLQPMVGGRRLKLGLRLVAGVIGEGQEGSSASNSFLLALNPLILRATVPW